MIVIPGKIPIRIYPFFWLLVFLISGVNSNFNVLQTCLWAFVILFSVTIHEFGHALTAVAYGQKAHIDLIAFGGLTHRHGPSLSLPKEFFIVLNGPVAGLFLGLLSYLAAHSLWVQSHPILHYVFQASYYANFFWTVVNLLPVYPLDGGHLLRIVFEGMMGLRGIKIALFISFLVSLVVSLFFFMEGALLIGAFFLMFTFESYRNWQNSLGMTESDKDKTLQDLFKNAEKDYQRGDIENALQKMQWVRSQSESGLLHQNATHRVAEIYHEQGRYKEAYALLFPLKSELSPEGLKTLHELAYLTNDWPTAIALGNKVYRNLPSYDTALINALSHAVLGEAGPAIGWLKCAIKDGLPTPEQALQKIEFNSIRHDPLFPKNLSQ